MLSWSGQLGRATVRDGKCPPGFCPSGYCSGYLSGHVKAICMGRSKDRQNDSTVRERKRTFLKLILENICEKKNFVFTVDSL